MLAATATVTAAAWYAAASPTSQHYEAGLLLGLATALAVALLRRFTRLPLGRSRPYAFALPLPAPDWRAPVPDPRCDPEALRPYAEQRAELLSNASALGDALRHTCALPPERREALAQAATTASIEAGNAVVIQTEGTGDAAYVIGELVAAVELSRIGMRALEALVTERPLLPDPPCYFNPLHGRGLARATPPGGDAEVAACPACVRGPAPLLVPSPNGPVPYYESEEVDPRWRTLGYGARDPGDDGTGMLGVARDGLGAHRKNAKTIAAKAS